MDQLLRLLSAAPYVSGETISREMGITRAAVWKQIQRLKDAGWVIESAGKRGYHLDAADRLEPELWADRLTTTRIGRGELCYLPECGSTNVHMRQLAAGGAPDGSLCLTECQTAGRGRLGRSWHSPAGQGLWLSLLVRPRLAPDQAPLLTLCAALAMREAVEQTAHQPVRIKWPNDLVLNSKKLCGILLEMTADIDHLESVVIGTGLNVLPGAVPPELHHQATSLAEEGAAPLRRDLLVAYLTAMEHWLTVLERDGFAGLSAAYRAASCTLGSKVRVSGAVELVGTAVDLDDTGALLVRDEAGTTHRVLSGDVSVRGWMGYV